MVKNDAYIVIRAIIDLCSPQLLDPKMAVSTNPVRCCVFAGGGVVGGGGNQDRNVYKLSSIELTV